MAEASRGVFNVAEINPYAPRPYTFTEAALCLRDSIRALGLRSTIHVNRGDVEHHCLVLGALPPHLPAVEQMDRRKTVIFNFEQLASAPSVTGSQYVPWLRQWLVADYHDANIGWLASESAGAQRAVELPVVPSPSLAFRPDLPRETSVDVLFFGTPSPRRDAVLQRLRDEGLTVETVAGAFGEELAPAIRRARIVLHVHFYEQGLFPLARILQPVAQGVPIVCESSRFSTLSDWSGSGIVFAPYEGLVHACRSLLMSSDEREERARRNAQFAGDIDFATPFERMIKMLREVPSVPPPTPPMPASPRLVPAPTQPPGTATTTAMRSSASSVEPAVSNEEIERMLAEHGHELPPESHLAPPPLKMVERQPGEGKFGAWVVWLLVIFSGYTIWQAMQAMLR